MTQREGKKFGAWFGEQGATQHHLTVAATGLLVLGWAALLWWVARPSSIAADAQGWRQADTQTMALLQRLPDASLLHPQVAWGGNGPGYVEAEFPLYAALVGKLCTIVGPAEWPGQMLSLSSMSLAGVLLCWELGRRFGRAARWVVGGLYFSSLPVVFLALSVQPDSLTFLFAVVSVLAFWRFVDNGRSGVLLVAVGTTALAGLTKAPALQLGIAQFIWLALTAPHRLKDSRVWFGWGFVLIVVGAYMAHAYSLYLDHGNTFGILGGDRKFPTLRSFFSPGLYISQLQNAARWGPGYAGFLALGWLLFRRRIQAVDWALWSGYAALLLVSQRYTSHPTWGSHYHVFGLIPGLVSVAAMTEDVTQRLRARRPFGIAVAGLLAVQLGFSLHTRRERRNENADMVEFGEQVRGVLVDKPLIVVRSSQPSRVDPFWGGGPHNFQNPTLFYLLSARGWVLPSDAMGAVPLARLHDQGATVYLEPGPRRQDPDLYRWLSRDGQLLLETEQGRAYRLPERQSASHLD